ncbi:MAG TPA: altronate dehydratase family protein [Armatimonadota bacterium]|jgi:altronate hydrolase
MTTAQAIIRIHPLDNVAVALQDLLPGETVAMGDVNVVLRDAVRKGHKLALRAIDAGAPVVKYGAPIGHATQAIPAGSHVHVHNLATNLGETLTYSYQPEIATPQTPDVCTRTFDGFVRADGRVGIRNEVWIIPTVGCMNTVGAALAHRAQTAFAGRQFDGVQCYTHPYGCSQLGEDHVATQRILAALAHHPNAGGVLVLGLGCENNHIAEFSRVLGPVAAERVKFLNAQDVEDELEAGMLLLAELVSYAEGFTRQPVPLAQLTVGLKCGGSDGLSGITANPLVGVFSDMLTACGGTTLLSEVPEMFGAETLLMNRCVSAEVFQKTVAMINDFKAYFQRHGQVIYENPSPGNKDGGISTLEDKSLGCTQKGGSSPVVDVLAYGDGVRTPGLSLLNGPGNDLVAVTALAAAGAHLVLFTTGRGTPLGAPVPTVKIATNHELAVRKKSWIDVDAGLLLAGQRLDALADEFFAYVIAVASGHTYTRNEENGFREIAIWKDGVTL